MSARHEIADLGRRAGLTSAEADQLATAIEVRLLQETQAVLVRQLSGSVVDHGCMEVVRDRLTVLIEGGAS